MGTCLPVRGSSVDCLDAKPLEFFKVVPHVLEHLGGVRLPTQNLLDYSQRRLRAVGPCRVAREPLVRQIGVMLIGACWFHTVDSAWSFADAEFSSPCSRIQRRREVDEIRLLSFPEIRAMTGFQQVPGLQVSLGPVVEGPGSSASDDSGRFCMHKLLGVGLPH